MSVQEGPIDLYLRGVMVIMSEEEWKQYWNETMTIIRKLSKENFRLIELTEKEKIMVAQAIGIAQGVISERMKSEG